jgi:hypothetical protein
MKRVQRLAVFALLDIELNQHASWCGETHLQKAMYVLQALLGAETGYDFILYKHGPFSFELRDDLSLMRADGLLEMVVKHPQYGPSYLPTEFANTFLGRFSKTVETHQAQARFVAEHFGGKNVAELERVATALFVRQSSKSRSRKQRAVELVRLKPHISEPDALQATAEIDWLAEESKPLALQKRLTKTA